MFPVCFAETLKVNYLAHTQELDGFTYIRLLNQAQDIVISCAGFLLCCDFVRITNLKKP